MTALERFRADENARKDWDKLVSTEIFDRACEVATLELLEAIPMMAKPEEAGHWEFRRQGAKLFLQKLREIAELPKPKPVVRDALPPNLPTNR